MTEEQQTEAEGETTSAQSRHWLTNDAAALLLTGVLCLLMVVSITPWYSASQRLETAFIAGFGVAAVWLFGKGAAKVIFGSGGG